MDEIKEIQPEIDGQQSYEIELAKAGSSTTKERAKASDDFFDEGEGQLTIDVYQTLDEIIVESPIAGVNPDELDINITKTQNVTNTLKISGGSQSDIMAVSNLNTVDSAVAVQTNIANSSGVSGNITQSNVANVINGF